MSTSIYGLFVFCLLVDLLALVAVYALIHTSRPVDPFSLEAFIGYSINTGSMLAISGTTLFSLGCLAGEKSNRQREPVSSPPQGVRRRLTLAVGEIES